MLIILLIIMSILIAFLIIRSYKRKETKERILSSFEQLAATMQMEESRIQRLPLLTLTGRYRTYPLVIECSSRKADRVILDDWKITTKLTSFSSCKFYIQGEAREGRLRKVMDLDIVPINDPIFDKKILVFASNKEVAREIFTPYLRRRFLWAGFSDFSMEIKSLEAVLELSVFGMTSIRYVRHSLEVWTEFLNILESI